MALGARTDQRTGPVPWFQLRSRRPDQGWFAPERYRTNRSHATVCGDVDYVIAVRSLATRKLSSIDGSWGWTTLRVREPMHAGLNHSSLGARVSGADVGA